MNPIIQAGVIADFIGFCSSKTEQSLAKKWLKIGKENFIERIFHETCFWGTCEASLRTKKPIESLSILFPPLLLLENAS
ncbi:hypothetical protein FAI40_04015 [Acetobacteraceae bacterium]|nr:hypothetical protein FAI40_04015 [Acetobacteraceae bacterium]